MKHINHPLVPKVHSPMYLMHSYDTRKPENVIRQYIECYCPPEGIVLDPFTGSGPMVIEAIALGRKAIGLDINPLAVHIVTTTLTPVEPKRLEESVEAFKNTIVHKRYKIPTRQGGEIIITLPDLYTTICPECSKKATVLWTAYSFLVKCPNCNEKALIFRCRKMKKQGVYECEKCHEVFNLNAAELKDMVPVLIGYTCTYCRIKRGYKQPDDHDLEKLKFIEDLLPPFPVPTQRFYYSRDRPFLTKRRIESVDRLFDKRNLITLSVLFHEICNYPDEELRELFKLAFSAGLEFVCRLNPLRPGAKGYSTRSGLTVHELWIPAVHCLNNPLIIFFDRLKKVIAGKRESYERCRNVKFARDINDILKGKANCLIVEDSATNLDRLLCGRCDKDPVEKNRCEGCIDFIFTDPPYGESIQTYELDFFRNAWLFPDRLDFWRDEIVINRNQGKDREIYYLYMRRVFECLYKLLKPEHYMVLTFHSSFIDVYNTIIIGATVAGFKLEKVIYQPPAVPSAKQSLHPYTSAIGDYYIRFKKPREAKKPELPTSYDEKVFERVVIRHIKEIIASRGEPTPYSVILKEIYPRLEREGFLLYAKPERIQKILEKYGEVLKE